MIRLKDRDINAIYGDICLNLRKLLSLPEDRFNLHEYVEDLFGVEIDGLKQFYLDNSDNELRMYYGRVRYSVLGEGVADCADFIMTDLIDQFGLRAVVDEEPMYDGESYILFGREFFSLKDLQNALDELDDPPMTIQVRTPIPAEKAYELASDYTDDLFDKILYDYPEAKSVIYKGDLDEIQRKLYDLLEPLRSQARVMNLKRMLRDVM